MKMEPFTIRIDEDLLKKIDEDVKKYRTSRSEVVRQILLYNYSLIEDTLYGEKKLDKK